MSISKKLQEVVEDDFGIDIEDVDDDFDPNHPYFSVSIGDFGTCFESHKDLNSVINMIRDSSFREWREAYEYHIYDVEGNTLVPNFSNVTLERG